MYDKGYFIKYRTWQNGTKWRGVKKLRLWISQFRVRIVGSFFVSAGAKFQIFIHFELLHTWKAIWQKVGAKCQSNPGGSGRHRPVPPSGASSSRNLRSIWTNLLLTTLQGDFLCRSVPLLNFIKDISMRHPIIISTELWGQKSKCVFFLIINRNEGERDGQSSKKKHKQTK